MPMYFLDRQLGRNRSCLEKVDTASSFIIALSTESPTRTPVGRSSPSNRLLVSLINKTGTLVAC
jgi:hypothetical protein